MTDYLTPQIAGVRVKTGLWTGDYGLETMDWNMDSLLDSFSSF